MIRLTILVALAAWLVFRLGYWFAPSYPVTVTIEQRGMPFDVLTPGGSCIQLNECDNANAITESLVASCAPKDESIGPLDDNAGRTHYSRSLTRCRQQEVPYFGREQPGAWIAAWVGGDNIRFIYISGSAYSTYGSCWLATQKGHRAEGASCVYVPKVEHPK